jgi:hypothetical protein
LEFGLKVVVSCFRSYNCLKRWFSFGFYVVSSFFFFFQTVRPYVLKKRWCAHAYINFLLPAWVFYLLGAVGYVIIDLLSAVHADVTDYQYLILFTVMAAIYLVDAVFYFLAWLVQALEKRDHEGEVVQIDAAAWGEIMYVFSALFGLAAAGCGFLVPVSGSGALAKV